MKVTLAVITLLFWVNGACAQTYLQYFDGADTTVNSVIITLDPDTANVWQIGRPQKTIFRSAATVPNALITDTIQYIPPNNTSSFIVSVHPFEWFGRSYTLAYQWKQKLDLLKQHSSGIIEYSLDTGLTWNNVIGDPFVYNLYGFSPANVDTLPTGEYVLSGQDTGWRDIWLCFNSALLPDSLLVRFTLKTDTADSSKEGWIIDNFMVRQTYLHTATKVLKETDKIVVYPTITTGEVMVESKKIVDLKSIQSMQLFSSDGRLVEEYPNVLINSLINIGKHPNGSYYLKVRTNLGESTHKIILRR